MPGADMRGADLSRCSISESSIQDMLTSNSSISLEKKI